MEVNETIKIVQFFRLEQDALAAIAKFSDEGRQAQRLWGKLLPKWFGWTWHSSVSSTCDKQHKATTCADFVYFLVLVGSHPETHVFWFGRPWKTSNAFARETRPWSSAPDAGNVQDMGHSCQKFIKNRNQIRRPNLMICQSLQIFEVSSLLCVPAIFRSTNCAVRAAARVSSESTYTIWIWAMRRWRLQLARPCGPRWKGVEGGLGDWAQHNAPYASQLCAMPATWQWNA